MLANRSFLRKHRDQGAISIVVGLVLALPILKLGPLAFPIVVFLFLILPWLVKDPFRLFIWLIVTWPVLTLYARFPLPAGIPDITYDLVLVLLIIGIMLIEGLVSKRKLHKVGVFGVFAGIFIAAQISVRAHVLWFGGIGDPNLDGLLRVVLIPLAMYWLTKNLLVSRWHLKWLLLALILATVIIGVSGLIEQAVSPEKRMFAISLELGGSTVAQKRWLDVPGGRAAGVLGNPAIYGAVLGMGVLASLCCLVHAERKRTQVALVASIVVLLAGVFLSYTRSAWVSIVAALSIAQFFMKDLWKKTLPLFLFSLLLLILVWGSLADNPLVKSRILAQSPLNTRLELAQLAWDRFLEKPFFGWGFGALDIFSLERLGTTSHNIYLTFLVDGGLVVLLSFSAFLVYLLIRAIRAYRLNEIDSFERSILAAMTGGILIFLVSGLSIELRYFGYFNALFWIYAGVIVRLGEGYGSEGGASEYNLFGQSVARGREH